MKGVAIGLVGLLAWTLWPQWVIGQEEAAPAAPAAAPAQASAAGVQLKMEPELVTVAKDRPSTFHALPGKPLEEVLGDGIQNYLIKGPETLMELAYAYDLGFNEVVLANPQTDEWMPPPDSVVKLSTQWIIPEALSRLGDLVVNVPEMRLYHKYNGGRTIETYPVGVGREGWETPYISTTIVGKKADPTWYVPKSILKEKPHLPAFVPPGPENPLGTHAIYLASGDYRIHGTNQPLGVGRRVSHGCMRLYPEDIITLFGHIQVGSKAHLVNEPVKAGWKGDALYLEVHPSLEGDENLRVLAIRAVNRAMERYPDRAVMPDWRLVDQLVRTPDGLPHQISLPGRSLPAS
ncbi:MAG: L,D-transpeptidase family protein [Magnetococcales bacterium]|nr:L,D-transpeptidase family protein [Magnetococcales bacterium]NGZ25422.1 L,D-transpeptidase family protein [Magnetococcales bacterium]